MGEMTAYTMDELVSQAESRGVTLAEELSLRLSAEDMEDLEHELAQEMSENLRSIEEFMRDVEVSSSTDFSALSVEELDCMQRDILTALSDGTSTA